MRLGASGRLGVPASAIALKAGLACKEWPRRSALRPIVREYCQGAIDRAQRRSLGAEYSYLSSGRGRYRRASCLQP
jgi:hypothetical protein